MSSSASPLVQRYPQLKIQPALTATGVTMITHATLYQRETNGRFPGRAAGLADLTLT
jgi:hypothetical protein